MKPPIRNGIWIAAIIVVAAASFFSGQVLFYKDGYRDGIIFADSSSYKRGKVEGYRDGYEYCDSITEDFERMRNSEMFNLNIIYEELAEPKEYIKLAGELSSKNLGNGTASSDLKIVKGHIQNTASFARYNELVVMAIFKDKQGKVLGQYNLKLPDVLYPRKGYNIEIGEKDVPALAESVELILDSAQGMD